MFGIHSIEYDKLESYFYIFGVLEDGTSWLSWDRVKELSDMIGVPTVPGIARQQVCTSHLFNCTTTGMHYPSYFNYLISAMYFTMYTCLFMSVHMYMYRKFICGCVHKEYTYVLHEIWVFIFDFILLLCSLLHWINCKLLLRVKWNSLPLVVSLYMYIAILMYMCITIKGINLRVQKLFAFCFDEIFATFNSPNPLNWFRF